MTDQATNPNNQSHPARFVSVDTLLSPEGPVYQALYPPPSRRALLRRLTAAGVPRFKCNGAFAPGRGVVYFDRAAVDSWLERNIGKGAQQ
jgi:hypothetical protein